MNLFRRRGQRADGSEVTDAGAASPDDGTEADGPSSPPPAAGPYDESEADEGVVRLDLGALRVPPRPGMELRLEMEDATKRVVAATIGLHGSTVQLQAFAAPRTAGIWDDIRTEIAAEVTKQGGSADEVQGPFGPELLARLPTRTADGRTGHRPVRFVGVDGPRWFVRGVFSGPAASDEEAARELEEVVRGLVVVRGTEAMAPRDLLPLRLPAQNPPEAGAAGAEGAAGGAAPAPGSPPVGPTLEA